jgi:hypothetical protein
VCSKEHYLIALLDSNGTRLRIKLGKIFGWGMFDSSKNSGCGLMDGSDVVGLKMGWVSGGDKGIMLGLR